MIMSEKIALVWLRRDLRVNDNRALEAAMKSGLRVVPVFVFDPEILEKLPSRDDRRVEFILRSLRRVEGEIGPILCFYGKPKDAFKWILDGGLQAGIMNGIDYLPGALFFNEDYETFALIRDREVEETFRERGAEVFTFTDQVIFAPDDSRIRKPDGNPYTIYTPFAKRWREAYRISAPTERFTPGEMRDKTGRKWKKAGVLHDTPTLKLFSTTPEAEQIGFKTIESLGFEDDPKVMLESLRRILPGYHLNRDLPAMESGTTKIGIHLRFGTINIREAVKIGAELNDTWLGELIWREFFMHIIKHFPYSEDAPFKRQYNFIPWRNEQSEIEAWMRGETGYPLVDAGMRELNETGHMHNRVRMVVASFLTKHLLTDWRIGEAYFAAKLNDYELSSNVGNWQWAAGTGCDAAPYFRIFNPSEQARKFDPQGSYIRRWVPEAFGASNVNNGTTIALSKSYPLPIVEHKFARERALAAYASCK